MTIVELDQKYQHSVAAAESLAEASKPFITGDDPQLGQLIALARQSNAIAMGIYAELVYARHSTPVVAAVPAKVTKTTKRGRITLSEVQRKKRGR